MTRMTGPDGAVMYNLINIHTYSYIHTYIHKVVGKHLFWRTWQPIRMTMYLCMNGHTYNKSMDQPGKVANPARGRLSRENCYFPVRVRA